MLKWEWNLAFNGEDSKQSYSSLEDKTQKRETCTECLIWGNGLNKNCHPMWKTPWPPWAFQGLTARLSLKAAKAVLICLILSSGPDHASSCLHIQSIMSEYFVAAFYERQCISPDVATGNMKYHKLYITVILALLPDPYLLLFLTWAVPPSIDRQKNPLRYLCKTWGPVLTDERSKL